MMRLLICLQLFYFIGLLPSQWKMFILTIKISESWPSGLRILSRDDMDFSVCFVKAFCPPKNKPSKLFPQIIANLSARSFTCSLVIRTSSEPTKTGKIK